MTLEDWCDQQETRSYVHIGNIRRVETPKTPESRRQLENLTDYQLVEHSTGYTLLEPKQ